MSPHGALLTVALRYERDIVLARQRARHVAERLGFDGQDQARISTAVSEIARNAFGYGGGGRVTFRVEGATAPQLLVIEIVDEGPGIADVETILAGRYRSPHGMGLGIVGARRLMDRFEIVTAPRRGTRVELGKLLPRGVPALDDPALARIAEGLLREKPRDAVEEVQRQNQELLQAMAQLTKRQEELSILNKELEDTNRGVVALYAELDEKADHLRRADEIKTRFLSNMTHEFRTPVNSIQALTAMLLSRLDGDLSDEQEHQLQFIRKAADSLSELVNDLLDLAKVEAGKTVVRCTEFSVPLLFGTLRGMLRPLLVNESVQLVFEDADGLPTLHTDEGKVSQILRNLVSNALKFTESGEVRISAEASSDGTRVRFRVADTGIGIPPGDLEAIFTEFTQVDSAIQRRVRGTGLGLPLCRKLATLLGGTVTVTSRLGMGSAFLLDLPRFLATGDDAETPTWDEASQLLPVLFVEDSPETQLVYEKFLQGSAFGPIAARTTRQARDLLLSTRPAVIVLDILLEGEDTWHFLAELKRRESTRDIPVLILSTVDDASKGIALGADAYCVKPIDRNQLLQAIERLARPQSVRRLAVIDDDEIARYVLRNALAATPHEVLEATNGEDGLALVAREQPDLVFLDLAMPGLDGYEVLRRLKDDPRTQNVPVAIVTSSRLERAELARLDAAIGILPKEAISRERLLALVEEASRAVEGST
jgi:signal transduction histidine kinase/DNA-binding response OmpR family regulator